MEKLSESEEMVMRCIWEGHCPMSLSDILSECEKHGHIWKPQTVSTFISRLVRKGYIEYDEKSRNRLYTAIISQEDYLNTQMSSMLTFWGKPSIKALASAFCRGKGISKEDLNELREMLDDMDK